jgi:hypothetical protein
MELDPSEPWGYEFRIFDYLKGTTGRAAEKRFILCAALRCAHAFGRADLFILSSLAARVNSCPDTKAENKPPASRSQFTGAGCLSKTCKKKQLQVPSCKPTSKYKNWTIGEDQLIDQKKPEKILQKPACSSHLLMKAQTIPDGAKSLALSRRGPQSGGVWALAVIVDGVGGPT